jgi:hypothetical protein
MTSVRGSALVFLLAFAGVVAASSMSRADVIGTCSCRSATCHGRSELKGANTATLREECHAKVGDHGFLSKMHRSN